MKFISGVVLLTITLNYCVAQSAQQIPIPILKENKKIDGLILRAFKDEKNKLTVSAKLAHDSCWEMGVISFSDSHNVDFQIQRKSKEGINSAINRLKENKKKFAYFNYKGNKVFVWAIDEFGELFTPTRYKASFNFVFSPPSSEPLKEEIYITLHYTFVDGHFVVEKGPPAVQ